MDPWDLRNGESQEVDDGDQGHWPKLTRFANFGGSHWSNCPEDDLKLRSCALSTSTMWQDLAEMSKLKMNLHRRQEPNYLKETHLFKSASKE